MANYKDCVHVEVCEFYAKTINKGEKVLKNF